MVFILSVALGIELFKSVFAFEEFRPNLVSINQVFAILLIPTLLWVSDDVVLCFIVF